jgi:hypothetical protein
LSLIFRQVENGLAIAHTYQYSPTHSTFLVEVDPQTFRNAALDRMNEAESMAYCEKVFADDLQGHALLSNKSRWFRYAIVKNRHWHYRNIVLLGDALRTGLFRDLPYTCAMNPTLGHEVEPEYRITPAAVKKKIMVIGAGPAGMEAAITAKRRGHDVTVFEKSDRIGGNLLAYAGNDLARPDDLLSVVRHYEVMASRLGIEMRFNTEANARFMRSILHQYDVCLIAAGARTDLAAWRHIDGAERLVDVLDVAHGKVSVVTRFDVPQVT